MREGDEREDRLINRKIIIIIYLYVRIHTYCFNFLVYFY